AQTGRFSWGAVAAGIPAGLLMTLLLYANNLRDIQGDREAGLRTLPMRFRPVEAKVLAGLFLAGPYLMTSAMAATGHVPFATQAALLTLPLAVRWFWKVWTGPVTDGLVKGMALLHLVFGLLFAAGLWMGR
ncbi:MAG: UbiA family prenyltransferase, partial [Lentisphaerae bacterium]|nr:UbiA family prenyltransferase [Lentisphaerota bacterium]